MYVVESYRQVRSDSDIDVVSALVVIAWGRFTLLRGWWFGEKGMKQLNFESIVAWMFVIVVHVLWTVTSL